MNRQSLSTTIALTIGIFLAASLSVYATSLGTNLLVTGNLTVSGGTAQFASGLDSGISIGVPGNTYGNKILTDGTNLFLGVNSGGQFAVLNSTGSSLFQINNTGNGGMAVGLYANSSPAPSNGFILSGNIGVGTTSPGFPLTVSAPFGTVPALIEQRAAVSANPTLEMFRAGTSPADIASFNANQVNSTNTFTISAGVGAQLSLNANNIFATPHILINTSGFVGIASSSPWGLLSLNPNGITGPAFVIGSSTATRFMITNGGFVGVATTSPWRTLSVSGTLGLSSSLTTGTTGNYLCINTTNYEITSGTTCSASSERFKDNIKPIPYGLSEILKLNPVSFTYKKEYNPDQSTKLGLIAEQVDPFIPELVAKDKDNKPESVDYAKLTPVLIRAVQEQDQKITALILNPQNAQSVLDNGLTIKRISSSLGTWSVDEGGTLKTEKIITKELCIGDTCLTESELKSLLKQHVQQQESFVPTPLPKPVPAPEISSSSPEASGESTSTQTANTSSVTEQPSPLFDVGTQPVSGTPSSKRAITVIIAAIMLALGAVVLVWRRGYRG